MVNVDRLKLFLLCAIDPASLNLPQVVALKTPSFIFEVFLKLIDIINSESFSLFGLSVFAWQGVELGHFLLDSTAHEAL
jgi:hypothetical protein